MDRLVRRVSMVAAKTTTRRGFLSKLVRGLVGAGLGIGFLFGAQRIAYATEVPCGSGCSGQGCPGYSSCEAGCTSCPATYWYVGCNQCCCGGARYRCDLCSLSPGGPVTCACWEGFINYNCP